MDVKETRLTWTEQFRHECEVRYVAKQSENWIKNHLRKVGQIRGEAAGIKLKNDVLSKMGYVRGKNGWELLIKR